MIGIVAPHESYSTPEQVEADRARWPEQVVIEDDLPLFDFSRCAEWMAEQTGEPLERCRMILFAEWGDEEDV